MAKLKCPKCGNTVFNRKAIEPVTIEIDDETGDITDELEPTTDPYYEYRCRKCNRELEPNEMIIKE